MVLKTMHLKAKKAFWAYLSDQAQRAFDAHMSDSMVGGRRKLSGINHIWVMNSIIHDTLSSIKKPSIVITKYDYKQMFDGMNSRESCGGIFEYGVDDNNLTLIHEANKEVAILVKTPTGVSNEYKLTCRTMQGDTWAPGQASAQVDSFGKELILEQPSYLYSSRGRCLSLSSDR